MRINAFIGEQSSRDIYKENDLIYNRKEMGTMGIVAYRSTHGSLSLMSHAI